MPAPTPDFVDQLEALYSPSWSVADSIRADLAQLCDVETVVDLGCGYGSLSRQVRALGLGYVGVDSDREALKWAQHNWQGGSVAFLDSIDAAIAAMPSLPRPIVVSAFSSHEIGERLLEVLSDHVRRFLLWDLTPRDLPVIHGALAKAGVRRSSDPRNTALRIGQRLDAQGWIVEVVETELEIRFPSIQFVRRYLDFFNVLQGDDTGVIVERRLVDRALREIVDAEGSVTDARVFVNVRATRPSV